MAECIRMQEQSPKPEKPDPDLAIAHAKVAIGALEEIEKQLKLNPRWLGRNINPE